MVDTTLKENDSTVPSAQDLIILVTDYSSIFKDYVSNYTSTYTHYSPLVVQR